MLLVLKPQDDLRSFMFTRMCSNLLFCWILLLANHTSKTHIILENVTHQIKDNFLHVCNAVTLQLLVFESSVHSRELFGIPEGRKAKVFQETETSCQNMHYCVRVLFKYYNMEIFPDSIQVIKYDHGISLSDFLGGLKTKVSTWMLQSSV